LGCRCRRKSSHDLLDLVLEYIDEVFVILVLRESACVLRRFLEALGGHVSVAELESLAQSIDLRGHLAYVKIATTQLEDLLAQIVDLFA